MTYELLLGIDPSGSFEEGKGTTGWCVMNTTNQVISIVGDVKAVKFENKEAYWNAHLHLIERFHKKYGKRLLLVIEDYVLYASKAEDQINSHMETSKLIGLLQHYCWSNKIPYAMQMAHEVKRRWDDPILLYKRYLIVHKKRITLPATGEFVHKHMRDAIRHVVHYATFKNK